jgi:hypothetical protein
MSDTDLKSHKTTLNQRPRDQKIVIKVSITDF